MVHLVCITKDSRRGAAAVALTYLIGEVASEMMFMLLAFPHKSLLNEMDGLKVIGKRKRIF